MRSASALDGPLVDVASALGKRKGKVPISVRHQPQSLHKLSTSALNRNYVNDHHDKSQRPVSVWRSSSGTRSVSDPLRISQQRELLSRKESGIRTTMGSESLQSLSLSDTFKKLSLRAFSHPEESRIPALDGKASEAKTSCSEAMRPISLILPPTPHSPSLLPKKEPEAPTHSARITLTPSQFKFAPSSRRHKRHDDVQLGDYLSKYSSIRSNLRTAWDTKGRLEDMELLYSRLKEQMEGTTFERNSLIEIVDLQRVRRKYFSLLP